MIQQTQNIHKETGNDHNIFYNNNDKDSQNYYEGEKQPQRDSKQQ